MCYCDLCHEHKEIVFFDAKFFELLLVFECFSFEDDFHGVFGDVLVGWYFLFECGYLVFESSTGAEAYI